MARCRLLELPGELRNKIYKHLVPTRCDDPLSIDTVRLVCRQIKAEFEYLLFKDISAYHNSLDGKMPLHIDVIAPTTYIETKHLRLHLTPTDGGRNTSENEHAYSLVGCVIPHIRTLEVRFVQPAHDGVTAYGDIMSFALFFFNLASTIDNWCMSSVSPLEAKLWWPYGTPDTDYVDMILDRLSEKSLPKRKGLRALRTKLCEAVPGEDIHDEGIQWKVQKYDMPL